MKFIITILSVSVFFYVTGIRPTTPCPVVTSCLLGLIISFVGWTVWLTHVSQTEPNSQTAKKYDYIYLDNPKFRVKNEQLVGVEFMKGDDDVPQVNDKLRLVHDPDNDEFSTKVKITNVKSYKSTKNAERYVGRNNIADLTWGSLLDLDSEEVSDEIRKNGIVAVHWSTPISSLHN